MRKWYIAGILLLLSGGAIVAALLALNRFILQNREFLLAQAEQALERKVKAGDIEWTIFSGIGIEVKDFALADDPAFSPEDFVQAKRLQINVRFWPLLQKRLEIKHVILREPVIRITRNAKGEFNVASIGRKSKPKEVKPDQVKPQRAEKGAAPAGFAVYVANIVNGEVVYQDRKEGTDLDFKQVDLTVNQASGNKRASLELEAALFSRQRNLKLDTSVGSIPQGAEIRQIHLDGTIDVGPIDLKALQNAVPRLNSLLPKELRLAGSAALHKAKFNGTLNNLAINGAVEGTGAAIDLGKNFNKPASVPLELAGDLRYANDTLYIRNADLRLHNLAVGSKGEIHLGEETTVNVALDSKPFSLAGWGDLVRAAAPYELSGTAEVHALLRGRVGRGAVPDLQGTVNLAAASVKPPQWEKPIKNLNTRINFNGQRAEIQKGSFELGNSKVRFSATAEKLSPLIVSYSASTPELRPTEFVPSVKEERQGDVFRNLSSAGRLNWAGGNLTLEGNLASSEGNIRKIAFQNLDAGVAIAEKVARVRSLRIDALGGNIAATGEYAFGESMPRFSLDGKLQKIDINEFYRALDPRTQRDLQGRLNATAKVSGSGKNWDEIKPNLHGQGDAEIVDGALLNTNLADAALSASGIPGLGNIITPEMRKKYPETFEAKDTKFKEMKAHFDIADGRINVKDLRVVATDYSMQGDGWANFERKINFRTQLILSPPLSADLSKSVRETRLLFNNRNEFTMPLTVSGTLPRVKTKPDSSALARMFQRGSARQVTEELERKFFGDRGPAAPNDGDTGEQDPAQKRRKKQTTEDLIRRGLEGFFKR